MKSLKLLIIVVVSSFVPALVLAQAETDSITDNTGYLSIGARGCTSIFFTNGKRFAGTGAGGQFAIQIAKHFNSHYFADWIVSNIDNNAQRVDFHSGFSMMPEVIAPKIKNTPISLFPLAGICIDYTKFTVTTGKITSGPTYLERYSFAVQAGAGLTIPVSKRLDFSLEGHYMVHIGTDIDIKMEDDNISLIKQKGTNLEGHFVVAVSVDYKLFRLWKGNS